MTGARFPQGKGGEMISRRGNIVVFAAIVATVLAGCGSGSSTSTSAKPSRGFTGTTARGPEPTISLGNQGLLLSDHTIFLNDIDYSCPAADTGTSILASVRQGQTVGFGRSPATCDSASHTAAIDIGPGPFTEGVGATAAAQLELPSGHGPAQGNTITPRVPAPADTSVAVKSQALLLTDGSAVLTVTYRCVPGPGGNTVGTLKTGLIQSPNANKVAPPDSATCDDRFHPVSTRLIGANGPFKEGPAGSYAEVDDNTGHNAVAEPAITISSSVAAKAPPSR